MALSNRELQEKLHKAIRENPKIRAELIDSMADNLPEEELVKGLLRDKAYCHIAIWWSAGSFLCASAFMVVFKYGMWLKYIPTPFLNLDSMNDLVFLLAIIAGHLWVGVFSLVESIRCAVSYELCCDALYVQDFRKRHQQ